MLTELVPHTLHPIHPLCISSLQRDDRHPPGRASHDQSQSILRGLPTEVPIRVAERHVEQCVDQRHCRPLAPCAKSKRSRAQDGLRLHRRCRGQLFFFFFFFFNNQHRRHDRPGRTLMAHIRPQSSARTRLRRRSGPATPGRRRHHQSQRTHHRRPRLPRDAPRGADDV